MDKTTLLKELDFLISKAGSVIASRYESGYSVPYVKEGLFSGFRTSCLSFIVNLYSENHPYYKDFNSRVQLNWLDSVEKGLHILYSIKHEIENDWLISFKQLVSAEIFSDFLEMSKYLLDEKYKDPAAVMIGSVLEGHLRFLCSKFSVDTSIQKGSDIIPKKAELLNSELVKANAYGILEQKSITAWLDLRNKAAHGKYSEYTLEQVNLMYLGVQNFILSHK